MFKFNLGDRVKDYVTGFEGVVVSRTQFLNRCIRYAVQPVELDKGRVQDCCHFDEEQLCFSGSPVSIPGINGKIEQTGGPHDPPQRRPDIKR